MNRQYDLGIIGIGVMGRSLALNFMDHGITVSAYNRDASKAKALQEERPDSCMAADSLPQLTESLKKPRRILLMVPSGKPVDDSIVSLKGLLDEGDIIMDGGNSFFRDTIVREANLKKEGILFFGVGVSGGEEGARKGPCIMPGGDRQAYEQVGPLLESIAAKKDNEACCTYIGPNGAGHYVKMVHNGIEYADMQLLAETYLLMKKAGYSNARISEMLKKWKHTAADSFLVDITADILLEKEDGGTDLLDVIIDAAGSKGTGKWTSIEALQQERNASLLTAAFQARIMSGMQNWRSEFKDMTSSAPEKAISEEVIYQAYLLAKTEVYAQGFDLYQDESVRYNWNLDLASIARIFRAGCIIQAELLQDIMKAYTDNPELDHLLKYPQFYDRSKEGLEALKSVCISGIEQNCPLPLYTSALTYLYQLSADHLGANLIQAQRDLFGAHRFSTIDGRENIHHVWHREH